MSATLREAAHNILVHPLMEILRWIGLGRWGRMLHDATAPKEADP